jgi:Spy/CpxP family protein refolding chaperone
MKRKGFLESMLAGVAAARGVICDLRRRQPEVRGYLDLIDLTDDQRRKVEQIRERFLPQVAGIREELRTRRLDLADLLFATPLDRDRISKAVEVIAGLQLRLEQEVIDHIIEENGLLTPDQQRQFHQVIIDQFRGGSLGVHDVRGRR